MCMYVYMYTYIWGGTRSMCKRLGVRVRARLERVDIVRKHTRNSNKVKDKESRSHVRRHRLRVKSVVK